MATSLVSDLGLSQAIDKAVLECAAVRAGEKVLVLADEAIDLALVTAFADAARRAGADSQFMVFATRAEINLEPPAAVAAAMAASDVVIDLTSRYFIHTNAYLEAREAGARILCASAITPDTLIRLVRGVDYSAMSALGQRVTDAFSAASICRVETGDGCILTMSVRGRPAFLRDGVTEGRGDLEYLPGAQLSIAPVEDSIEGDILIDGTAYPPVGPVGEPLRLGFRGGRLVEALGGPSASSWWAWLSRLGDPKMFQVAHISVGLNPLAELRGQIIEDERLPGCFDIGMGSQMPHLMGSLGKAASHSDVVATNPTISLDGRIVASQGRFHI
jgi:leucyl aminopeptidase (aminopeptidase T)